MKSLPTRSGFHRLTPDQRQRLNDLLHQLNVEADHFLGYPCNRGFDYSPLYPFLCFPMNNVGDPFFNSNYHLNTHAFEREEVQFIARLMRASKVETDVWVSYQN